MQTPILNKLASLDARLKMTQELNDYLGQHCGFFGFISWWGVNKFVQKWIAENRALLEQYKKEVQHKKEVN